MCCQVVLPAFAEQHGDSGRSNMSQLYHKMSEKHFDRICSIQEMEAEDELEQMRRDKVRFAPQ